MEHMDEIIRAREIIKRKYNALRRGEEETSLALEKHFKPVAEPLKAILRTRDAEVSPRSMMGIKKEEKPEPPSLKKPKNEEVDDDDEDDDDDEFYENYNDEDEEYDDAEEERENDDPLTPSTTQTEPSGEDDDAEESSIVDEYQTLDTYINSSFGPISSAYIRAMITDGKDFDNVNGFRAEANGEWMLGNKIARFDKDDNLLIGDHSFAPTNGLLELIFKREPQEFTTGDLQQYKRILDLTNAHRQLYAADKPIRATRAHKYTSIIKDLYSKESLTEDNEQRGSGLFVPLEKKRTYVYWDDPNELVERLALLAASREAGNTGLDREILSIEEELREAGYIL